MSTSFAPLSTAPGLRIIATAGGDPFGPTTWSGLTANVAVALQALGLHIDGVDPGFGRAERWVNLLAGLPSLFGVRRVFGEIRPSKLTLVGQAGDHARWVRSELVNKAAKDHGSTEALIFSNSGLSYPRDVERVVLVEDMTIEQVASLPGHYYAWEAFRPAYLRKRSVKQARQQRAADMIGFLTSWSRDAAVLAYDLDIAKTAVIGVGSRFAPRDTDRDWSVPRFLFVGMDWERKNVAQVVEGFRRVRQRHRDAELHLVGRHPKIDEPGVINHGWLTQSDPNSRAVLHDLFARSTCFVLPSSLEPAGIVFAEACSQGIPSIAGSVGGAAETVGDAGLIVDPRVRGAVADAMLRAADPVWASATGEVARRRAHMLTWDACARRLSAAAGWWDGPVVPLTPRTPAR